MRLAIFDIDGTLTETNSVDEVCFVQAFADAHAIKGISTDWGAYTHTTDSWITREILRERLGRLPDEAELGKFRDSFVSLLEARRAQDAGHFAEVAGASTALERLGREPEWAVAIASGCWRESGLMKLSAAGIKTHGAPAAFAEDGMSREEILRAVFSQAQKFYGCGGFEKVVSLGDGLWDVRTARNLGVAFVGVGSGEDAEALRRAGASHCIEDFRDYGHLLRCLNESEIPGADESATETQRRRD